MTTVGQRCEVLFDDDCWYAGVVDGVNDAQGCHVVFDDGDQMWERTNIRLLEDDEELTESGSSTNSERSVSAVALASGGPDAGGALSACCRSAAQ